MLDTAKRIFYGAAKQIVHPFYRQVRGLTLGTRTLVLNDGGREILLVRHTYAPGWLLPGGGVDRGETIYQSAVREVNEEGGIVAAEEPLLHGLFLNDRQFRGDHVACFVLRKFRVEPFSGNFEIAEARFFPVAALPDGTTGGTKRRINEVMNGLPATRTW
jgi:8-oxo-dGTP pyrophosphatase MutT (NUDIX family)